MEYFAVINLRGSEVAKRMLLRGTKAKRGRRGQRSGQVIALCHLALEWQRSNVPEFEFKSLQRARTKQQHHHVQ